MDLKPKPTKMSQNVRPKPLTSVDLLNIADFIETFENRLTQFRLARMREFLDRHPTYIQWPHWPHEALLSQVFPSEIPEMVAIVAKLIPDIYSRLPPIVWCEWTQRYHSIHTMATKPNVRTETAVAAAAEAKHIPTEATMVSIQNPSKVQRSELWSSPKSSGHACVVCKELKRDPYCANVVNLGCGHAVCCVYCVGWYNSKCCWACSKPVTEWIVLASSIVP